MEYPKGYDETFIPVPMQNTHWYNSGRNRGGWTANPFEAPVSEVLRVGLHDCDLLACTGKHSGTKVDWEADDE